MSNNFGRRVLLATWGKLYEQGKVSSGLAAQLLGCDRREFYRLAVGRAASQCLDYAEGEEVYEAATSRAWRRGSRPNESCRQRHPVDRSRSDRPAAPAAGSLRRGHFTPDRLSGGVAAHAAKPDACRPGPMQAGYQPGRPDQEARSGRAVSRPRSPAKWRSLLLARQTEPDCGARRCNGKLNGSAFQLWVYL